MCVCVIICVCVYVFVWVCVGMCEYVCMRFSADPLAIATEEGKGRLKSITVV